MSADERLVVTGATGFLGASVLTEIAREGGQAIGITRHDRGKRFPYSVVATDLAESSDALQRAIGETRATILIHCALPPRDAFATDPVAAESLTERIDLRAIDACAGSPVLRRVVLVSSSAVYGLLSGGETVFRETGSTNPANAYGRTKLAQEGRWQTALGERLVIARVFNVTGPGEPTSMVVGSLAQRIARARPQAALTLTNSESVRDFCDVRDVAKALLHLGRLRDSARLFNVCSGIGTTILELANLTVTASGRKVTIEPDGKGGESRSVGDPQLLRNTGWRNTVRLNESVNAVWSFSATPAHQEIDPSFH